MRAVDTLAGISTLIAYLNEGIRMDKYPKSLTTYHFYHVLGHLGLFLDVLCIHFYNNKRASLFLLL